VHHAADASLAREGVMNEGTLATISGLKGIPVEAETIPLARDLQLAALTGVRYHAAQLSTAGSVELIAAAKRRAAVTAGISINNLALNENDVAPYRTFFKLSPPLRSEDDRQAMIEGLKSGAIDVIHSAHDPQDFGSERQPFAEASEGAIGLETLLAAALRLVHSGDVPLMTVLRAMTQRPAEILGLGSGRLSVGAPADFILIDPEFPWVVAEKAIVSRSHNTAFEGARLQGAVMQTFVAGRSVFRHAECLRGANDLLRLRTCRHRRLSARLDPFGLLITQAAGLGDVRKIGSGNIGATNVLRTGRRELAALTLILDGPPRGLPRLSSPGISGRAIRSTSRRSRYSSVTAFLSGWASRAAKASRPSSASCSAWPGRSASSSASSG